MKRHHGQDKFDARYTFQRDDGYHEIAMIMTTVDLNDRLSFQKEKIKIVVDIEHNYVPNDHKIWLIKDN